MRKLLDPQIKPPPFCNGDHWYTHVGIPYFGSRNSSPTNNQQPPGESSIIFDIHAKGPEFENSLPSFLGPVQIMGNLRPPQCHVSPRNSMELVYSTYRFVDLSC